MYVSFRERGRVYNTLSPCYLTRNSGCLEFDGFLCLMEVMGLGLVKLITFVDWRERRWSSEWHKNEGLMRRVTGKYEMEFLKHTFRCRGEMIPTSNLSHQDADSDMKTFRLSPYILAGGLDKPSPSVKCTFTQRWTVASNIQSIASPSLVH